MAAVVTRTVLDRLVSLKESPAPRLLLLTDTVEVCGRGLLYCLVCAHLRAGTHVLYLTTSFNPVELRQHIKDDDTAGKIEFYDGATDPCGWDSGESAECVTKSLPEVMRSRCKAGGKVAVVVDRLEHLMLHQDSGQLVRGLHTLARESEVEQVVVYCGRDVVCEDMLEAVTHLASGVLHLRHTQPCSCAVLVRKTSGKVIKAQEEFSLTPDFRVQGVKPTQNTGQVGVPADTSASSDPTPESLLAATTFSLSLTDEQRRAKNELLLPHTRVQTEGGQILYTPDQEDDWDEDDPDDDLDI
ncbi:elongator complex protein 5-like [Portunus trituberculatus]|uniref:Elongator complex protein 5 n=1 Tax=Portunus trituberculatus TaxID=210409 RepID=A0A5B7DHG4_PORTR|nr:elongator complex protein 5-like [Portunus trituberculatus]XP_045106595.1 elongator complex protein 5-like [Portunus trituberculatus]MPC20798.1 Elongator complex protein 5 [Portunus trituberculatus]